MHGGGGAIQENVNEWLAGELRLTRLRLILAETRYRANLYFGHVLLSASLPSALRLRTCSIGVAMHASAGYLGISESARQNSSKYPGEAGTANLNPRFALRLQGDYVSKNFLSCHQNNFQFSAHLVIRLGHKVDTA